MTNRVSAGCALLLSAVAMAQGAWESDFAKAKAAAHAQGKEVFLEFAGPDQNALTTRLHTDVFAQTAFLDEIQRHFVLVRIPAATSSQPASAAHRALAAEYGVSGRPVVFLTDARGRPYAQTGYLGLDVSLYLRHIGALRHCRTVRDAAFDSARSRQGSERAKALAAALDAMDKESLHQYRDEVQEIIRLCTPAEGELKKRFQLQLEYGDASVVLSELLGQLTTPAQDGNWDEFSALLHRVIDAHEDNRFVQQCAHYYLAVASIEGRKDLSEGMQLLSTARGFVSEKESRGRFWSLRIKIDCALRNAGELREKPAGTNDGVPAKATTGK